jgi:hypothetical protein
MEEKCILVGMTLMNVIHPFLYAGKGRNWWMALDSIG